MRVGRLWIAVLLGVVLVLPVAVVSQPEAAQAVEPTVVSALDLPTRLQVGQSDSFWVSVSGPVGRPVQVQFRRGDDPWRTVATRVTNTRHRVLLTVAVTTPGGPFVWQAKQRGRLWAVAGQTTDRVAMWRVRVPAVPGWARAVSPAEQVQAVRYPRWIRRVNVSSTGAEANGWSASGGLSADGRYVVFDSWASNLVADDTNDTEDVFVRDRATGQTSRVSVSSTGAQADGGGDSGAISGDGRYVAFTSGASNLVPGDTNEGADVFVHDRATGQTSRVSVSSTGLQANASSEACSISANGRYVAFESDATNLAGRDTNGVRDVFVHNRVTGHTARVSVSSTGTQANHGSGGAAISGTGRYLVFGSEASNLVRGDTNRAQDVFVHDRATGRTSRVSVSNSGEQAQRGGSSWDPAISADGRYVAFFSWASNLVPGDTNAVGDVFVRDRESRKTTRVNVSSTGAQANQGDLASSGGTPAMSADGRLVTFTSSASNLVPSDTTSAWTDVFVHDQVTGRTRLVGPGDGPSQVSPVMSGDGRFVFLSTKSPWLVTGDSNQTRDHFVARLS